MKKTIINLFFVLIVSMVMSSCVSYGCSGGACKVTKNDHGTNWQRQSSRTSGSAWIFR